MSTPPATGNLPAPHGVDSGPVPDPLDADSSKALFEELDALLDRMLALPVRQQEEAPDGEGADGPPEDVALITIAEAMLEAAPPSTAPLPPVSAVDESLYSQTVLGLDFADLPEPEPPPAPGDAPMPGPAGSRRAAPVAPPQPEEPRPLPPVLPPPAPPWLRPLLWCDRRFDACTGHLGAAGRWLRGPSGRALLGWSGLLLIATSLGLALGDWFGWTW